jgi:hypothetical protein
VKRLAFFMRNWMRTTVRAERSEYMNEFTSELIQYDSQKEQDVKRLTFFMHFSIRVIYFTERKSHYTLYFVVSWKRLLKILKS